MSVQIQISTDGSSDHTAVALKLANWMQGYGYHVALKGHNDRATKQLEQSLRGIHYGSAPFEECEIEIDVVPKFLKATG